MTILKGNLGFKGERGYSNYEIYVKNGGTLTEQEWLDHFGVDLTDVLKTQDTVDDLTSTSTTKPLSANQGKTLNTSLTTTNTNIGSLASLTTSDKTSVVNAINDLNTGKQAKLVSGTNLRTVNGSTLLGSANLLIKDVEYRDWSQQFACSANSMTTGTVEVPEVSGYTCIANVLRSSSSNYLIYELAANGSVKIYNHSSGTLTVTLYGRFIYVRSS